MDRSHPGNDRRQGESGGGLWRRRCRVDGVHNSIGDRRSGDGIIAGSFNNKVHKTAIVDFYMSN